jgi:nucleotidyltransferase substrate binding protein (TIGR01987 family)
MLDITSLKKSVSSLKEAIDEYNKNRKNAFVRDSVIQRFEYSYELSFKYLKRYLEETSHSPQEISQLSFQNIIRIANEQNLLLNDLTEWNRYRQMRNITSRCYDENEVEKIIDLIPSFYDEAVFLLEKLEALTK